MTRIGSILCVVDPGRERERVLERSVSLAMLHQAELTVIDVVSPPPNRHAAGRRWPDETIEAARERRLAAMVAPYGQRVPVRTVTVSGIPFLCIIREVLRRGHDLVVRQAEQPDWLHLMLGSDDMHLLRKCPCPVWVTHREAPKRCRRILAAVDLDQRYPVAELETRHTLNRRILEHAYAMAIAESAELHLVHVSPWPTSELGTPPDRDGEYSEGGREAHERALSALLRETSEALSEPDRGWVERHAHLLSGDPRREIPDLTRRLEADLLVMGSVGRTGIPGFLIGNTAEAILCQLVRPVLVIKPPGFVTPVTIDDSGPAR